MAAICLQEKQCGVFLAFILLKEPGVTALPVHTPDSCHHRQYPTHGRSDQTSLSLLDHYFNCPLGSFTHNGITREFANLTYNEYW